MNQTTETISEFYAKDHDRLDGLFREFQALKNVDFDAAKANFREFNKGLKRHIVWEEQVLFPFFEAKTGMTAGPTMVMRGEHRVIGEALEAIHDKVRQRRTDSDADEARLLETLSAHNMKEESVLYPMLDQASDEKERAAIFKRMADIPADTGGCCGMH